MSCLHAQIKGYRYIACSILGVHSAKTALWVVLTLQCFTNVVFGLTYANVLTYILLLY